MALIIETTPENEALLQQEAELRGVTKEDFVAHLLDMMRVLNSLSTDQVASIMRRNMSHNILTKDHLSKPGVETEVEPTVIDEFGNFLTTHGNSYHGGDDPELLMRDSLPTEDIFTELNRVASEMSERLDRVHVAMQDVTTELKAVHSHNTSQG